MSPRLAPGAVRIVAWRTSTRRVLLDSPLVGLADVACSAARSKASPRRTEAPASGGSLPRRGVLSCTAQLGRAADPELRPCCGLAMPSTPSAIRSTAATSAPPSRWRRLCRGGARRTTSAPPTALRPLQACLAPLGGGMLTAMLARGALSELEVRGGAGARQDPSRPLPAEATARPRVAPTPPATSARGAPRPAATSPRPTGDAGRRRGAARRHCSPFPPRAAFRAGTGESDRGGYLLRLRLACPAAGDPARRGSRPLGRSPGSAHHSHFTARSGPVQGRRRGESAQDRDSRRRRGAVASVAWTDPS